MRPLTAGTRRVCTRCGREWDVYGEVAEPESYVCSLCLEQEWLTTRKPSAGAIKRKAQSYLAR
jgi:hypothetical protein